MMRIISFTPLDIKRGYLYHTIYSEDTGEVRVLRYKIRNWEQIKEYVQE